MNSKGPKTISVEISRANVVDAIGTFLYATGVVADNYNIKDIHITEDANGLLKMDVIIKEEVKLLPNGQGKKKKLPKGI